MNTLPFRGKKTAPPILGAETAVKVNQLQHAVRTMDAMRLRKVVTDYIDSNRRNAVRVSELHAVIVDRSAGR